MIGRLILLLAYLGISVLLFATFATDVWVWISFFMSNLVLFGFFYWHLYQEKDYSPFVSVFIVFSFLFFIVAPLLQIGELNLRNGVFPNKLTYREDAIIFTNILIIIFNLTFFLSYIFFKKVRILKSIPKYNRKNHKNLPLTILSLTLLSALIFVSSYSFVQEEVSRPSWKSSSASIGVLLLWKKVLFMVPFAGIILCFQYFKKKKKLLSDILIIGILGVVLVTFLIWFKNPLTEKRNALGPIYISLIYLIVPVLLNSNTKTTLFMFFSMIIVFPLSSILTHVTVTFREILIQPRVLLDEFEGYGIGEVFNTIHYDAFINITATIDYVKYEGFAYGYQLLSGLLFFVPRRLWKSKPLSTGNQVGEHLIDYYGFNYGNLSNPLVSEGYVNFGISGVFFMALILALVCVKLLSWLKSDDYLKKMLGFYFAIHLLFLLRGDFANGFSYYIGIFVGVLVLTRIITFIIEQLLLNQRLWKLKQIKKV